MTDYLFLFGVVLAIHLMPAFTPPTWPVIVLYSVNSHLPIGWLVVIAAVGAALGRHLLAILSKLLEHRFPERMHRNLIAARELIERRPANRALALGLFVFTPLPSAQLFEAAGLLRVRLWPCTAAFFVGRLGFYSVYAVTAREVSGSSVAEGFRETLGSPAGVAVQIALLVLLVFLTRFDWSRFLRRP